MESSTQFILELASKPEQMNHVLKVPVSLTEGRAWDKESRDRQRCWSHLRRGEWDAISGF